MAIVGMKSVSRRVGTAGGCWSALRSSLTATVSLRNVEHSYVIGSGNNKDCCQRERQCHSFALCRCKENSTWNNCDTWPWRRREPTASLYASLRQRPGGARLRLNDF